MSSLPRNPAWRYRTPRQLVHSALARSARRGRSAARELLLFEGAPFLRAIALASHGPKGATVALNSRRPRIRACSRKLGPLWSWQQTAYPARSDCAPSAGAVLLPLLRATVGRYSPASASRPANTSVRRAIADHCSRWLRGAVRGSFVNAVLDANKYPQGLSRLRASMAAQPGFAMLELDGEGINVLETQFRGDDRRPRACGLARGVPRRSPA